MKCEKKSGQLGEMNGVYYIFDKKFPLFCYYELTRDWYRYVMQRYGVKVDAVSSFPLSNRRIYDTIFRPMKRVLRQELAHISPQIKYNHIVSKLVETIK